MKRILLILGLVTLGLGAFMYSQFGAAAQPVRALVLQQGNLPNAPVAQVALSINGEPILFPYTMINFGGANTQPRTGSMSSLTLRKAARKSLTIETSWIEIPTGRAYEISTSIRTKDVYYTDGYRRLDFALFYLPGGRLTIASDTVPQVGTILTKTIAELCGTRRPDLDMDLMNPSAETQNRLPLLAGILARLDNPVSQPPCQGTN